MNIMKKDTVLSVTKSFDIRFSEVDSMGVVWHGNYAKYFEDAREEFGRKYDLGCTTKVSLSPSSNSISNTNDR